MNSENIPQSSVMDTLLQFANAANALLADPDYLALVDTLNRPNWFAMLAASSAELWHSRFLRWLLDPSSHLGLDTFPLERFLFVVAKNAQKNPNRQIQPPSFTSIAALPLKHLTFKTEYSEQGLVASGGGSARIDIYGWWEDTHNGIQIIIENKIKAQESVDQTNNYYQFAQSTYAKFPNSFLVFLTPDENQDPQNPNFVQILYQDICDLVLWPCLRHPRLTDQNRVWLQEYLLNLATPLKGMGGRVMADPYKELCETIYKKHENVLNQIFLSVRGETPQQGTRRNAPRRFETTLKDLVDAGKLEETDTLYHFDPETRTEQQARLIPKRDETGNLVDVELEYNRKSGLSLSAAAISASGNRSENGWRYWQARSITGDKKGSLLDIRNDYIRATTQSSADESDTDVEETEASSE